MNTTTPRLEIGHPAPTFTLPAIDGTTISRGAYRQRKHLVIIVFPGVDLAAREYIHALRERYSEIRAAEAEVLVLVTDPAASAEGLAAALEVPFPILLDPQGEAARRYLPDGARLGLFILDRYGALHAQWALTAPPLPATDEIIEWLTVIGNQCVL